MANLKVNDLVSTASLSIKTLTDSQSYLSPLSTEESEKICGGQETILVDNQPNPGGTVAVVSVSIVY